MKMDVRSGPAVLDLDDACARNGVQRGLLLNAARAFVQSYGLWPDRIAAHLAGADYGELCQGAHRIKGAATLLGAYRLSGAAGALEDAVRSADTARLPALGLAFQGELAAALAALQAALPQASPAPAAVLDSARRAAGAQLVAQLLPLLRDGDYAAASVLDRLDALLAGSGHAALLAAIRRQFDDLETEQAAALAERLGVALG
ncbi:MAG TPA: Hpt domain-containing protein [Burkholderiaceae bacterium]|nr:Hpt domain-containing protein [Burkholderiaceae bacterium]